MKFYLFILLFLIPGPLVAREPQLRELEKIALQKKGLNPEEILSWKSRSRWAPLLPRITAGYDQNNGTQINNSIQDNVSVTSSSINIGPPELSLKQDEDYDRGFDVKAYWNLNELIFNRDELAVSSEARYRTLANAQIIDELHQTWFERKRLLLQYPDTLKLSPTLQLKLEELEAKLNSLTEGAFEKILGEAT